MGTHKTLFTCVRSRCHALPLCSDEFLSNQGREAASILPAADKMGWVKRLPWSWLPCPCPSRDGEQLLKKRLNGCVFSAWLAKAGRCGGWLGGNNSFSFNVPLCGGQSPYRIMVAWPVDEQGTWRRTQKMLAEGGKAAALAPVHYSAGVKALACGS